METKKNYWIAGLILIGFFFVLITGWSVFTAGRGVSSVVDPNYYAHGLRYNDSQAERRAVEILAWDAEVALAGRQISVHLSAGNTDPVSGCRGQISLYIKSKETRLPISFDLHESSPGMYSMILPANIEGTVPAELTLGRDGMVFRRNILLNLKSND